MAQPAPARIRVLCLGLFLLQASAAAAQTVSDTTGTLNGTVVDATGAALTGVVVTVSGGALLIPRQYTTGPNGFYRLLAVPPGDYAIVFSLHGFKTRTRTGVRVTLGSVTTIDETLQIADIQDRVSVQAESPVVDRYTTVLGTLFDGRQLANLPGSRNVAALLADTPSVFVPRIDVGGSNDLPGNYSAYGTAGANRPRLEGINISGFFPFGFTLDFGSFDAVSVGTGAHGPEWPAPGVQMQLVAKSGGNRFGASLYADYEDRHWQSINIDADEIRNGVRGGEGVTPEDSNRLWHYQDVNTDAGGFLRKDKWWWYLSFRDQDISARFVTFARPHRTQSTDYTAKSTYQLTSRDKLVVFAQVGRNHRPDRLDPFGPAASSLSATTAINELGATANQLSTGTVWKGEWSSIVGETFFVETRVGQFLMNRTDRPNSSAPRYEDVGTLRVSGGNRDWQQTLRRTQLTSLATFVPRGALENHMIKFGGELIDNLQAEAWRHSYAGDVLHVLNRGAADKVYLFQTPSRSVVDVGILSAHINDAWRTSTRLTVNAGLRWDRYRLSLPAQVHATETFAAVDDLASWNVIAPRLGATYDVRGNGKTLLKVSFGRYCDGPATEAAFNANPNSNVWWRYYNWTDVNQNGSWDRGEEGALLDSRGGTPIESLDPALELLITTEATAFLEHAIASSMGIRTGMVWRGEHPHWARQNTDWSFHDYNIPVIVRDPGPDGQIGTGDDGRDITAYDLPGPLGAHEVRNVPGSDTEYWTWETTASRRFTGRWSLVAGFAETWYGDHAASYAGQAVRNNVYPLTPNDLINTGPEGRHAFHMWTAKIHGTVAGPWGLQITPLLRHQSGQPFGRTITATLSYGTVRILAEPVGTRRMDNISILDLRVERGIRLTPLRQMRVFFDVFNLLNANPEQNTIWSSTPPGSFLRPTNIVAPRIARIGVKASW